MRRGTATQDKQESIAYSVECNEEVKADTEDSGRYDEELEDQDEPEQNEWNVQENAQEEQDKDEDKMAEVDDVKEDMGRQFNHDKYKWSVFVQDDVLCNLQDNWGIPSSWMLLVSQMTVNVFCNLRMLSNICDTKRSLNLHCNAGATSVTKKGDLKGYGTICYHPTGIVNNLSLNNVKKMWAWRWFCSK